MTEQLSPFKMDDESIIKLEENFTPRAPVFQLGDMVMNDQLGRDIQSVIARIENHETLYTDWGLSQIDPYGRRVAVNFYGPSGTGKTMCAESLASYFRSPIIEINYAEIESKFVGDTPKNIVAAFKKAAKTKSILLFDEADSILGRRMTSVTQSADHGVNVSRAVMLRQMDIFTGIVIFCTNLAQNYDQAFVRRIQYHLYFPVPDLNTRKGLWEKLIPSKLPGAADLNLADLAKVSKDLTGGDIRNAILTAAATAVQRKDKKVTTTDLKKSVQDILRAKKEVGHKEEDANANRKTRK